VYSEGETALVCFAIYVLDIDRCCVENAVCPVSEPEGKDVALAGCIVARTESVGGHESTGAGYIMICLTARERCFSNLSA
jgi:hypothetical protein